MCSGDYLLFLNPDTMLYKDSLNVPIAFMEDPRNRRYGICGIQLVDEESVVSRTCAVFPTPQAIMNKMTGLDKIFPTRFPSFFMDQWDHRSSREVDHVIGAFYMIRRGLFSAIDGFDEDYFLYFEDLDLSRRAFSQGNRSYYLTEAKAFHKGGGASEQIRSKRLAFSLSSRILYGFKHFTIFQAFLLMSGTLVVEPLARSFHCLFRRSFSEFGEVCRGFLLLYAGMPSLLRLTLFRNPS